MCVCLGRGATPSNELSTESQLVGNLTDIENTELTGGKSGNIDDKRITDVKCEKPIISLKEIVIETIIERESSNPVQPRNRMKTHVAS